MNEIMGYYYEQLQYGAQQEHEYLFECGGVFLEMFVLLYVKVLVLKWQDELLMISLLLLFFRDEPFLEQDALLMFGL
jgi:hypothetical protein